MIPILLSCFNPQTFLTMTLQPSQKSHLTQKDYQARLQELSNPDDANKKQLTSKDVATLPKPGTTAPTNIKFLSPDHLVYLVASDPTSLVRQMFILDVTTGVQRRIIVGAGAEVAEGSFSLEEQMRRERARLMATGVTSFEMSSSSSSSSSNSNNNNVDDDDDTLSFSKLLIPHGGGLWITNGNDMIMTTDDTIMAPRLLIDKGAKGLPSDATLLDAKISADGSTVAFVADKEVYVMSTDDDNNGPKQVTFGARQVEGRTNGVADYLAMEELERSEGFWLASNGQYLAFEQVDEAHIPAYRIVHQAERKGLASSLEAGTSCQDMVSATKVTYEEHRYPFAGTVNPKVKLGIQKIGTNSEDAPSETSVLWLDVESIMGPDVYLAKVEWLADSSALVVQILDRRQQKLALVLFDAATGQRFNLHLEQAPNEKSWVNLNGAFRVLDYKPNESIQFLWASEKDGYRHLYVMETTINKKEENEAFSSRQVHRVTGPGEFIVENVVHVDPMQQWIYFMGTSPGKWLGKRLFRAKYSLHDKCAPQVIECMTPEKGQHSCVINTKSSYFVDSVSTVDYPTKVSLRNLESGGGDIVQEIYDASQTDPRVAALDLQPPTVHTFPSLDQQVTLQAAVYLPDAKVHGPGPYPLLVATYGGPHVQYVQNSWGMMTADLRSQFLRNNGFAIIKVDNRGSNRRGLVFETPIYGQMGELEVADQVAGVQWAVQQGFAEKDKVAVSGWSYGGYMALKCLSERPDVFHAAVSGAPVTDWTLYDTAYTERYMGLPQENVAGYQKSSALNKIANIEGSLLLCHGLQDENVLFRQTAVLINELIEFQKAYDLAMFPSERHGPRRPQDRAFLEERILAFLQRSLCL